MVIVCSASVVVLAVVFSVSVVVVKVPLPVVGIVAVVVETAVFVAPLCFSQLQSNNASAKHKLKIRAFTDILLAVYG